ncbi:TetR/AcrR family transcriptional regulator [Antribacter sp. KLBMP9083]|uniref:TetR/AcrR family transcriptional regulator n=1 Tax=Antribacter soli TaxID=2910976 RepID=A0AA41QAV9_9MICO|nr:TetR/AcrR family transcriptional regulator [Antribacter soli]MCF4119888.1 TetR/AcrR family transcriptional regulator [Antribacter soli]
MELDLAPAAPARDRRVRRSRAALTRAAVALVTERGTAAIPISDIAAAADVSRQLVYQHFGDRDALLLEAALDLVRTELLPRLTEAESLDGRSGALVVTRYFAEHRVFYRAMLNSSSAFALNKALGGLFVPVNRRAIERHFARDLDPQRAEDLAVFMTGGGANVINEWLIGADDPLDPEDLADRIVALVDLFATALPQIATSTKENDR